MSDLRAHDAGHDVRAAHAVHDIRAAHAAAAEVRTARFGALPERVALEDMVQAQPALPANQAVDSYDCDGVGTRFSCLAADLGL